MMSETSMASLDRQAGKAGAQKSSGSGVGATKPASETERASNRRVEVIFVPEGGAAPED